MTIQVDFKKLDGNIYTSIQNTTCAGVFSRDVDDGQTMACQVIHGTVHCRH